MAENQQNAPQGMNVRDVLFILFRHKWKILIFGVMGLAAAVAAYFHFQPGYEATAKLLVRYVTETRGPEVEGDDRRIMSPSAGGDSIIEAEVQILTSFDLALEVARRLGPVRILSGAGGETNLMSAAEVLVKGVRVDVPRRSGVMVVSFGHPDPEVAREVLNQIIELYLEKHLEVHRAVGAYEFLSRQTDELRSRLAQTEDDLNQLKARANIVTLEESKRMVSLRLENLQRTLSDAEAELASRMARLQELQPAVVASIETIATNATERIDPSTVAEYQAILQRLAELRLKAGGYASIYTSSNSIVQLTQRLVEEQERWKREFEAAHPQVLLAAPVPRADGSVPRSDLALERAEVAALKARITELQAQLDRAGKEAEAIASVEAEIVRLERRKELEEQNYRYFSASLEKARIDEALDPTKMPNISKVQEPVVSRARNPQRKKVTLGLAAAGFGIGIALAFLVELFIDQTFKRPQEVEARTSLRVLMSIPRLRQLRPGRLPNGLPELLPRPVSVSVGEADSATTSDSQPVLVGQVFATGPSGTRPPGHWPSSGPLQSYCEALRDRMILFFQLRKLAHKPKLVAVTSCTAGAGGSTIAAGLAASLSETGDGKVLLVDMNVGKGAVHPFYRGCLAPALPETLNGDKPQHAMLNENLYVASAGDGASNLSLMLPRRFGDLVPKMRASDYDYIIFDMPPISQTASTLTLSSFMDQVLMVIEAEKTPRDSVRKAAALLQQTGTNVFGVFNKSSSYGPDWVQPES